MVSSLSNSTERSQMGCLPGARSVDIRTTQVVGLEKSSAMQRPRPRPAPVTNVTRAAIAASAACDHAILTRPSVVDSDPYFAALVASSCNEIASPYSAPALGLDR